MCVLSRGVIVAVGVLFEFAIGTQLLLHRLHLPRGFHVAQHPGHVGRELLVLQPGNRVRASAFEQVDSPVDAEEPKSRAAPGPLMVSAGAGLLTGSRPRWRAISTTRLRADAWVRSVDALGGLPILLIRQPSKSLSTSGVICSKLNRPKNGMRYRSITTS